MNCNLINQTGHRIAYRGELYFSSGHFRVAPSDTRPNSTMAFSIMGNSNTWEGVTGGAKFHLLIVNGGETVDYPFALGYCAPAVGHYKSAVVGPTPDVQGTPTPQAAYDACVAEGGTINFTAAGKNYTITASARAASDYTVVEH